MDGAFAHPAAGRGNWFVIPFAALGAIIVAIGLRFTRPENHGRTKAGLWLNLVAIGGGALRLSIGGGLP